MRWVLRVLDRVRPWFETGRAFGRAKPLFDATDAFLFSHAESTVSAPHVRDPVDVKRVMWTVVVALLPALAASVYFFGLRVLAMVAVSYVCGGIVEVVFALVRKEEITEGFLVTGLLFALILPPGTPLWMVGLGVVFGVTIGKEVFGGTGHNVFNPALVGRCFLILGYPATMRSSWIDPGTGWWGHALSYVEPGVDALTQATPLSLAHAGRYLPVEHLFWGYTRGCAGETSGAALLLGGLFLLATRVANWRTVVSILGTVTVLQVVLHAAWPEQFGPALYHLLAGGLLLGALFMATDPVSSPITRGGKWAYGILIATVVVLIRNIGGFPEGVMFAILLGNVCAPLLDEVAYACRVRRLAHEA